MADKYEETKADALARAMQRARYAKLRETYPEMEESRGEASVRGGQSTPSYADPRVPYRFEEPHPDIAGMEQPFVSAGVPITGPPQMRKRDSDKYGARPVPHTPTRGPGEVEIVDQVGLLSRVPPSDAPDERADFLKRPYGYALEEGTRYAFSETDTTPPYQILVPDDTGVGAFHADFEVSRSDKANAVAFDALMDLENRASKRSDMSPETREKFDNLMEAKARAKLSAAGFPLPRSTGIDSLYTYLRNEFNAGRFGRGAAFKYDSLNEALNPNPYKDRAED